MPGSSPPTVRSKQSAPGDDGKRRGTKDDYRTSGFGFALIGEHQRMAVDNAGRRRQQRGDAIQCRFKTLRLRGAEPFDIIDAIGAGCAIFSSDGISRSSAATISSGACGTVIMTMGVQPRAMPTRHLSRRFKTARRVVDPAMDDLAVAGSLQSRSSRRAQHPGDLVAGHRQCPRRCRPTIAPAAAHSASSTTLASLSIGHRLEAGGRCRVRPRTLLVKTGMARDILPQAPGPRLHQATDDTRKSPTLELRRNRRRITMSRRDCHRIGPRRLSDAAAPGISPAPS